MQFDLSSDAGVGGRTVGEIRDAQVLSDEAAASAISWRPTRRPSGLGAFVFASTTCRLWALGRYAKA